MRAKALILLFAIALAFAACQTAFATDEGTYSVREYILPAGAAEIGAMTVDEPATSGSSRTTLLPSTSWSGKTALLAITRWTASAGRASLA